MIMAESAGKSGEMDGLVKMSRYAGMREDLVQAGGGNSSFKMDGGRMAVKASGTRMADMTAADGYALVDAGRIKRAFLENSAYRKLTEEDGRRILEDAFLRGGRPSIETFLHAVSGICTLHTHPVVVNALACRKSWREELSGLFPEAMLVPYATPGIELVKEYFSAYEEYGTGRIPETVFLQNHGLVVSAGSADAVIKRTEAVTKRIEEYLGCDYGAYHDLTRIWALFPDKVIWKVTDANILRVYGESHEMWDVGFCPDCVVFLGKAPLRLTDGDMGSQVQKFRSAYGEPAVVVYRDSLYLAADSVTKALELQSVMGFSAQVAGLNREAGCVYLSEHEQNMLLDWDAEKYRKNMGRLQ